MKEGLIGINNTEKEIGPDVLLQKLTPLITNKTSLDKIVLINVSGASAAGKSTISKFLASNIEGCASLNMDDYLKGWGIGLLDHDSGNPNKPYFARLNPNVYDLEKLYEHVVQLKNNESIEKPVFNEIEKRPSGIKTFNPPKVLVLEGIYTFEPSFFDLGDIPILVEASLHDRLLRKIIRNRSYGENINHIINNYLTNDEPTYPFYRNEYRSKAKFIVNNPSNPVLDFTSYPEQHTIKNTSAINSAIPRANYGNLHPEERLEFAISQDNEMLLNYSVGNKLLISDVINSDIFKLLENYYEIRQIVI